MPFTVSDFEDLVRLLYERPEWRERLRSLILPEEILTLPQLVRENTQAIGRLEKAVAELVEAQRRSEEHLAISRAEFYEFRASVDKRFSELREAQQRTDERLAALSESTEKRFAEMREWAERRFAETQQYTDERISALQEWAERRFAEMQKHTDEKWSSLREWAEQRFVRLESRVDNLYSEVGRLTSVIGASLEEEAQASVATLMRHKGFKAPAEGYPLRLDGEGEMDVVLPVESPEGEKLTVIAESKARLSRRAVVDWANRMNSPEFRRRLREAGVPGPYLVYTYAIRVDPAALDAAREVGIGVMSGRGVLVDPREPLPEV